MRVLICLLPILTGLALPAVGCSTGPSNATAPQAGTAQREALEMAILERDVWTIRRLIASGVDLDQRMFLNETPSIKAAIVDAWDIVLIFLENGADPSLTDARGNSIAAFARTSRVVADGRHGRALARVRQILEARGLP